MRDVSEKASKSRNLVGKTVADPVSCRDRRLNNSKLMRRAHVLARKLDMDHETLHDFCCATFEVDSMAELTIQNLYKLNRRLQTEINSYDKLSKLQEGEIYKLGYRILKWKSKEIKGFIKRQIGHYTSVQNLDRLEATKVINGLRKIAAEK